MTRSARRPEQILPGPSGLARLQWSCSGRSHSTRPRWCWKRISGLAMRALGAVPVEVHCQCPIDECVRRYAERAPSRHPVHGGAEHGATAETFARSARPIGQGPVVTVDTTRPVDIQLVAAEIWRLLGVSQPAASRDGEPVSA
jgi:hypothetical protein